MYKSSLSCQAQTVKIDKRRFLILFVFVKFIFELEQRFPQRGSEQFLWMGAMLSSSASKRQLTISSIILVSRLPSTVISSFVSISLGENS